MIEYIKKHPFIFSLLVVGIGLILTYYFLEKDIEYEVTGTIRMIAYAGFFLFFLSVYILFVSLKKVIWANLILIFLLVIATEITCFLLLDTPSSFKTKFENPDLPEDHVGRSVGVVLYADSTYHALKLNGADTVFNVRYTIDHDNKRVTPEHDSLKQKYALFFGCSITFGEGVEDNQTIPYYFQQNSGGEYNSYNFGVSGHGTNHVLSRLQHDLLTKQVKEKDGVAYYVFFWDHIRRGIGSMQRYTDWLSTAPYFEVKDGKVERKGSFIDGRKTKSKLYELLYQTNIVKYFQLDLPLTINSSHIDYITSLILESKKEYQKQFGNDRFICVIYPQWKEDKVADIPSLKQSLEKKGIQYIDLSSYSYTSEKTLGGDVHPNPNTHKEIADLIRQKTKIK